MYILPRADHFGFNNLVGSLSFEETDSPSFSRHCLPVALHVVVGPCGVSSVHGLLNRMEYILDTVNQSNYPWLERLQN